MTHEMKVMFISICIFNSIIGIAVLFIWFLSQRINVSKTPTLRIISKSSARESESFGFKTKLGTNQVTNHHK